MTDSILISTERVDMSGVLDTEKTPERVIFSLVFLVPFRMAQDRGVGLFVYNYSPDRWKLWFPPYHFHVWEMPRQAVTYAELIANAVRACPDQRTIDPEGHLPEAIGAIQAKFGLGRLEVNSSPMVQREAWLRFSKTENQWTLYLINYYLVTCAEERASLVASDDPLKSVIPLYGPDFCKILSTERYRGLGVSDNLVNFLREQSRVELLVSSAL